LRKIEASAPANVQPSSVSKTSKAQPDFVRHCTNRKLPTEAVLNYLRTRFPRQYAVAEVVGKWVWLDVSPSRKPNLAALLWALGFHWNRRRDVWQHPCGSFDPLDSIPPTPARSIAPISPLTCCPLERTNTMNANESALALSVKMSVKATSDYQKFLRFNQNGL
jgi:hypothetical protein